MRLLNNQIPAVQNGILGRVADRKAASKKETREEERIVAAGNLAGLWKTHNNGQTVEESVRMMKRGRQFDT